MQAIAKAKGMYMSRGLNFEQILGWYLMNGIVISNDSRFLMAKVIDSTVGDDDWNPEKPDCWYVECAVGKNCLGWFLEQATVELPYLAWRRLKDEKNVLKFYETATFKRFAK